MAQAWECTIEYFVLEPLWALVLFPDPTPKRRRGPSTHQALSGAYFWISTCQSDSRHVACMWLSCDTVLQPTNAACESSWCVVMTIIWHAASCAPQRALDAYQTLSLLKGGIWGQDYGGHISEVIAIIFLAISIVVVSYLDIQFQFIVHRYIKVMVLGEQKITGPTWSSIHQLSIQHCYI